MSPILLPWKEEVEDMKIKYNFGLLKNQSIGFLNEYNGTGYHGILRNVKKKGNNYQFQYEGGFVEISEMQFLTCRFVLMNEVYYFIPNSEPVVSGLFVYSMYDTYGFPMEITEEILQEQGYGIDRTGFELMKEIQKKKNKGTFKTKDAF